MDWNCKIPTLNRAPTDAVCSLIFFLWKQYYFSSKLPFYSIGNRWGKKKQQKHSKEWLRFSVSYSFALNQFESAIASNHFMTQSSEEKNTAQCILCHRFAIHFNQPIFFIYSVFFIVSGLFSRYGYFFLFFLSEKSTVITSKENVI